MGVIESGSKTVVLSCLKNLAVGLYYKMSGADGVGRKRVKKVASCLFLDFLKIGRWVYWIG